jgi:lipoprotein-releasing system ATP-binding protein
MTDKQPVIEARNITRILPLEVPVTLVKDISLSIYPGEFISVTGPSGSGKSSLLYLLGLLDRPTQGDVLIDGEPTTNLSQKQQSRLRLQKLGFVFQFHFLLSEFTVIENIMIPMKRLGQWPEGRRREEALKILEELDIADQADKRPSQLSGGQRQRVAVARAVANQPQVILADEPTGNLDTKNSKIVHDIFRHLVREHGTTIVMVTHDMDLADDTDRNIHLVDGELASLS